MVYIVGMAALLLFAAEKLPLTQSQGLDMSHMPQSICGWPSLHDGGKFAEWNTRMAQYLLGFALNVESPVIDGVFTDETTKEIEDFQKESGLEINGFLNIATWPTLMATVTPLQAGESAGLPVEAIQDALIANGFPVTITGTFDNDTITMLSSFQTQRGASVTTGEVVDEQTWHLLATGCNSSLPGYYWFDAGWPQGLMSEENMQCLHDQGFVYTTIECWREKDGGTFVSDCLANVANAKAAGFDTIDLYMFPDRYQDPILQSQQMLANVSLTEIAEVYRGVMLDIEGSKWTEYSQADNQEYILQWRSVFDAIDVPMVMYTGSTWNDNFGADFTSCSDMPLVYAHYDNVPSFYDYDYAPFGGWGSASGKQFWDAVDGEVVCGVAIDWDWSPEAFWKK